MSTTIPPDVMERLKDRAQPRPRPPFPWGKVLVRLVLVGAIGWFAFQYWYYRLPQVRDLTLKSGKVLHVRLDAHDNRLLEATVPESGKQIFIAIADLSTADQDFVNHLKYGLNVVFPINYDLTDNSGKTTSVSLEARDHDWVQVTFLANNTKTFLPISSLSQFDQSVVQLMTPTSFNCPASYVLTGPPSPGKQVILMGNDKDVFGYTLAPHGPVHYRLVSELSDTDRGFLKNLGGFLNFDTPLDCAVETRDGTPLNISILFRVGDFLALKDPDNGAPNFHAIADFSAEDQKALNLLSARRVPDYPFAFDLVDPSQHTAPVTVLGISSTDVKLRLANGLETNYPLNKLSGDNQNFLRFVYASKGVPDTVETKNLRVEIATLEKENLRLEAEMANPDTSYLQSEIDRRAEDDNNARIKSDQLMIQAQTGQYYN